MSSPLESSVNYEYPFSNCTCHKFTHNGCVVEEQSRSFSRHNLASFAHLAFEPYSSPYLGLRKFPQFGLLYFFLFPFFHSTSPYLPLHPVTPCRPLSLPTVPPKSIQSDARVLHVEYPPQNLTLSIYSINHDQVNGSRLLMSTSSPPPLSLRLSCARTSTPESCSGPKSTRLPTVARLS